jgi:hypothetical protein
MRQTCSKASFLEEHRDIHLVLGELWPQHLDHEQFVEAAGTLRDREIYVSHPAARELCDQVILPDLVYELGSDSD